MNKLVILGVIILIVVLSISLLYGFYTDKLPKIPRLQVFGDVETEIVDLPFCSTITGCEEYFKSKGLSEAQINEYHITCLNGICEATIEVQVVLG